jgi:uncharacterized DUF497 family protein
VEYEWDEDKRRANLRKHGLDFMDADRVVESTYALIRSSPRRGQAREQAFAYVFEALTVLTVVFEWRGHRCRVLSFRPAKKTERNAYHDWLQAHDHPDHNHPGEP